MLKAIEVGAANTEVLLEVAPGVKITAIITKASAEKLSLSVDKEAYAVVKSSDVRVAIDQSSGEMYAVLSTLTSPLFN